MTSRFSDHVVKQEVRTLVNSSNGDLSIERCTETCDAQFLLVYISSEERADLLCSKECTSWADVLYISLCLSVSVSLCLFLSVCLSLSRSPALGRRVERTRWTVFEKQEQRQTFRPINRLGISTAVSSSLREEKKPETARENPERIDWVCVDQRNVVF